MGYRPVEVAVGYPLSEQAIRDALQRYAPDVPLEHEGKPIPLERLASSCLRVMGVKAVVDEVYPRVAPGKNEISYFVVIKRPEFRAYEIMDMASLIQESTASRDVKKAFDITGDLKA